MKPNSASFLSPRLEVVLGRLCQQLGPLFKTQAVKLPYLVDVVAVRRLGRPITDGHHQTWELGVVTREVFRAIQQGRLRSFLSVENHPYSESGRLVRLVGPVPLDLLSTEELQVVDDVAECFGSLPAEELGVLTKLLNTELPVATWGSNAPALTSEQAYLRLSASWQRFGRKIPGFDLDDRQLWSEPVENDPMTHLRRAFS